MRSNNLKKRSDCKIKLTSRKCAVGNEFLGSLRKLCASRAARTNEVEDIAWRHKGCLRSVTKVFETVDLTIRWFLFYLVCPLWPIEIVVPQYFRMRGSHALKVKSLQSPQNREDVIIIQTGSEFTRGFNIISPLLEGNLFFPPKDQCVTTCWKACFPLNTLAPNSLPGGLLLYKAKSSKFKLWLYLFIFYTQAPLSTWRVKKIQSLNLLVPRPDVELGLF